MSRILFLALSLVLMGGAVSYAGNPDGEPEKGAAVNVLKEGPRCIQHWDTSNPNSMGWEDKGGNGGGGTNYSCTDPNKSVCPQDSWKTEHPVGWNPADEPGSYEEWVWHGRALIEANALESGVVIPSEYLDGIVYYVEWVD